MQLQTSRQQKKVNSLTTSVKNEIENKKL